MSKIIAQAQSSKPEIVQQRIIRSEEEITAQQEGYSSTPVPSFVYVVLAIGLVIAAVWAIKQFIKPTTQNPKLSVKKVVSRPKKISK